MPAAASAAAVRHGSAGGSAKSESVGESALLLLDEEGVGEAGEDGPRGEGNSRKLEGSRGCAMVIGDEDMARYVCGVGWEMGKSSKRVSAVRGAMGKGRTFYSKRQGRGGGAARVQASRI